jgi:Zn-dependent protease
MILITLFFLFAAMVVHEISHGLVAHWLGDDTAKRAGRLTLNPIPHIDPFWTLMFPGLLLFATGGHFMIGMAKPVPVDISKLRNPRRDMVWVALAGPLSNILMAAVLAFFFKMTHNPLLLYGVYMNLGLGALNLIPLPPLDGSRILAGLLPLEWAIFYLRLERYGFLLVLILYFTGFLMPCVRMGMGFFCWLLQVPSLTEWLAQ